VKVTKKDEQFVITCNPREYSMLEELVYNEQYRRDEAVRELERTGLGYSKDRMALGKAISNTLKEPYCK